MSIPPHLFVFLFHFVRNTNFPPFVFLATCFSYLLFGGCYRPPHQLTTNLPTTPLLLLLLPRYMDVLYPMTVGAIKTDEEDVAMLAVEFWSTLCETELNLDEGIAWQWS